VSTLKFPDHTAQLADGENPIQGLITSLGDGILRIATGNCCRDYLPDDRDRSSIDAEILPIPASSYRIPPAGVQLAPEFADLAAGNGEGRVAEIDYDALGALA